MNYQQILTRGQKIILRGRQQHLLEQFKRDHNHDLPILKDALDTYIAKNLHALPHETSPAALHTILSESYADLLERNVSDDTEAKKKMHVKTALAAARALTAIEAHTDAPVSTPEDSRNLDDILMPYLDAKHGSSVNAKDHSIFTKLTNRYEDRFMQDMRALNVLDPDDMIRATESVGQIINFVGKIQRNGFAYWTASGVYFDVESFEKANNHYARLEPWNRNDTALQADGEGAITGKESMKSSLGKRSQADFALWKVSKPGEPSWMSPWGEGRPGWHIECSAMASDLLGSQFDIHSGGIDLAFPHHDNELAQSEAYWRQKSHMNQHQWVNYFIHMGHLSIAGAKMSKSLKNFTTIRDALSRGAWTSRGLRIVLLLGGWREGIEITDDLIKAGSGWEDKVNNFFINAKDAIGDTDLQGMQNLQLGSNSTDWMYSPSNEVPTQTNGSHPPLNQALERARSNAYDALCDSFNTAAVMGIISELITTYNATESTTPTDTTYAFARWVTCMVNMFGLNGTAGPQDLSLGWSGLDVPEFARPALTAISNLRDQARTGARSASGITHQDVRDALATNRQHFQIGDPPPPFTDLLQSFWSSLEALPGDSSLSKNILKLCDEVRDRDLWSRGIYLEDRDGNKPALIRLVTKEMRTAREEKEDKERQKVKAKADREAEAAAKADKGRLSHLEMFRTDEYSAWDDDGIPVKDKEGEEITKSRAKKLRKDWERQKKLHEAWMKAKSS